jgi:hypothetical protein
LLSAVPLLPSLPSPLLLLVLLPPAALLSSLLANSSPAAERYGSHTKGLKFMATIPLLLQNNK